MNTPWWILLPVITPVGIIVAALALQHREDPRLQPGRRGARRVHRGSRTRGARWPVNGTRHAWNRPCGLVVIGLRRSLTGRELCMRWNPRNSRQRKSRSRARCSQKAAGALPWSCGGWLVARRGGLLPGWRPTAISGRPSLPAPNRCTVRPAGREARTATRTGAVNPRSRSSPSILAGRSVR
jgi:hypothetical protein